MKQLIQLSVNGQVYDAVATPGDTLAEVLRNQLSLTGTKVGCGAGDCGACTVLVDNEPVLSCLTLAFACQGKEVATIEGEADAGKMSPVQQAFVDHGAVQCGFCTPGMLLSARVLLEENEDPTDSEIARALSGNLCRCTGYVKIIEAVQDAGQKLRESKMERVPLEMGEV